LFVLLDECCSDGRGANLTLSHLVPPVDHRRCLAWIPSRLTGNLDLRRVLEGSMIRGKEGKGDKEKEGECEEREKKKGY